MKTIFFKDLEIGQEFGSGELAYIKIETDKGVSLAGSRLFNLMEIVSIPKI